MLWDIEVKSGKLSTQNVLEINEFKAETRSKEKSSVERNSSNRCGNCVIQEVHA